MARTTAGDGMTWLTALLPATQAMACYAKLDTAAALVAAGDDRTKDQRRADLLVDAIFPAQPTRPMSPPAEGPGRPSPSPSGWTP